MSEPRTGSLRARVRAEMTEEIKHVARRHLDTDGANLSLRAVARDMGMVSSAVYRYFASRDELLTALILDAYNSLGEHVERAEAAVDREDVAGRWAAIATSARGWSLANRPEYALTYGSPVPGYAAPQDTIAPASRPVVVFVAMLQDGVRLGVLHAKGPNPAPRLPASLRAEARLITDGLGFPGIPEALCARGLTAWAQIFGVISFELFGRLQNAVTDFDAFYEHQVKVMAQHIGFGA